MAITVGDLKEFFRLYREDIQEDVSTLMTGLTAAMEEAGTTLYNQQMLSAAQSQSLGYNTWAEMREFQDRMSQRLLDYAASRPGGSGPIPTAEIQAWRQQVDAVTQDFAIRGDTAAREFGEQIANAGRANLLRTAGEYVGPAVDAAQVFGGIWQAMNGGGNDAISNALGGMIGGVLGTILGTLLAAMLISALALTGLGAALLGFAIVGIVAGLSAMTLGFFIGMGIDAFCDYAADQFSSAMEWMMRRDPLTLDLDGDGIDSVGLSTSNPILFDHDGDGIKNGTGWVLPDDGFLVLDRNGNGTIDNGRELFGDSTPLPSGSTAEDGFAALAAEDTNDDGVVNASDARFAQLRVWRDLNQNGISEPNELFTMSQLGITSINVGSVARNQALGNGNRIADVGSFTRSDGTEGSVGETHGSADVDLASDTFHREFPDHIPLVAGVKDLPNAPGAGLVRDLWEAASQSPALLATLEQFCNATTRAEQLALIDTLILRWADTAGLQTMQERAEAIDHVFGFWRIGDMTYPGSGTAWATAGSSSGGGPVAMPADFPDPATWEQRRAEWDALVIHTNNLFTVLEAFNGRYFFAMPEDPLPGARSGVSLVADSGGTGGGSTAYAPGPPGITIGIATPQLDALNGSYAAIREFVYNALALQTRLDKLTDMIIVEFDSPQGITLDFSGVESELRNRISTDAVSGMADLVEYTRGMMRRFAGTTFTGLDMIQEYVGTLAHTSALDALYTEFGIRYATGEAATDVGGAGTDFIIGRNQTGTEVEYLHGNGGTDVLLGNGGRDSLYGDGGTDTLVGGAGDDYLNGGANEDVLIGGAGNDSLRGEGGDDVFAFGRGDGQDHIDAYDTSPGKRDELRLGPDIGSDDVILTRSYADLIVSISGTTDRVIVSNFFADDAYAVNGIRLSDGTIWDLEDIKAKVQTGTSANDILTAHPSGSALYGMDGNDTLNGGAGNDVLEGGNGDDLAIGGAGDDTITDNYGANTMRGGAGNDTISGVGTLEGGTGNDTLIGTGAATTYVFNLGDGADTISDWGYGYGSFADTLQLGAGITPASVSLVRTGNDLTFRFNQNDQVTVTNWFADVYYNGIERLTFADGTVWDQTALQALVPEQFFGSIGADTINGWDGIDLIDGGDGDDIINGAGGADTLQGSGGADTLRGGAGADLLQGGDGNDNLNGDGDDDTLEGGAGDDTLTDVYGTNTLRGGAGVDTISGAGTLEGGTGNDTLIGTGAATTYAFNLGDGADTISDWGYGYGSFADTLQLGAGITAAGTTLVRTGDDLTLRFNGTDQVTVKNWFVDVYYNAIERVTFADGTVWDHAAMYALLPQQFVGSGGADTINGWDGIDLIDGGDGNDTINGAGAADTLQGAGGDDTLRGGAGADLLQGGDGNDNLNGDGDNDILEGGAGNDTLTDVYGTNILRGGAGADTINGSGTIQGGTGNDILVGTGAATTYLYNLGDGLDTISDWGYGYGDFSDTLQIGAGITPASVTFVRTGNDLTFRFSDTDQVTVTNWFADVYYNGIERVTFADGTVWDQAAMQSLVGQQFVGTSGNDTINGWDGIDLIDGADGNDTINGAGGNDTLQGSAGDDTLRGGTGADLLLGGDGNDNLNGDGDNDTLEGGAGDDTITDVYGANVMRGGAGVDTINGAGTLQGGTGNDILIGNSAATTYLFDLGDGADTVTDWGYGYGSYLDTLTLGAGITAASTTLVRTGDDLSLRFNGSDQVTVKNWFVDSYYNAIERVTFADGTVWDTAAMQALVPQQYVATSAGETINGWDGIDLIDGGDGNDTINGAGGADTLQGSEGDDTLRGGAGADLLQGGAGNDNLNGDGDNDILEGGAGNDTLIDIYGTNTLRGGEGVDTINGGGTIEGGAGNDILIGNSAATIYLFNLGDGADTINDWGYGYGSYLDTLTLGAGIIAASTTLVRTGDDLTFQFNASDRVTVKNWFVDPYYNAIERVTFADGTVWDTATMQALVPQQYVATSAGETINGWDGIDLIDGGDGNDTINGAGGNDTLQGSAGNDTLRGGAGADLLLGGDGNDNLNGDGDNDTLEGGAGDDTITDIYGTNVLRGGEGVDAINGGGTIEGGAGNDILSGNSAATNYVFNLGDGTDAVTDWGYGYGSYLDTLTLGAGIAAASTTLVRTGDDLTFQFNASDGVTVKNWFVDTYYNAIERVTFADGTVWDTATMQALVPQQYVATAAADTINGWDGIDLIDGADGNDTINGAGGNDTLQGSAGNDTLRGGAGADLLQGGDGNDNLNGDGDNDTLEGGAGDDTITDTYGTNVLRGGDGVDTINGGGTIEGGAGNDILTGNSAATNYVFNLGDGADTINDWGYGYGSYLDRLTLGAGISAASTTLVRTGDDLSLRFNGTDQVTVKNWFVDPYYNAIEGVTFADGTVWDTAAMQALVPQQYVATAGADTVNGWDGIDLIDGADGNDTINGAGGNDTLQGSAGNDTLRGGAGADLLQGGDGNDNLNGDADNDTLEGGAGDDTITDTYGTNTLRGGEGVDTINGGGTIEGGTGNDILTGNSAATIYLFNLGDGADTINDWGYGYGSFSDTLQFGAGITPASVTLVRSGNDLTFRVNATDQVTVKNWYADVYYNALERVTFADGTVWDQAAMQPLVTQQGSSMPAQLQAILDAQTVGNALSAFKSMRVEPRFDVSPGVTSWAAMEAVHDLQMEIGASTMLGADETMQYGVGRGSAAMGTDSTIGDETLAVVAGRTKSLVTELRAPLRLV